MTDVYQQIAGLSPEKRELLELLLKKEGIDIAEMIIPHRRDTNVFPLSLTQERLWTTSLFALDTPLGNIPLAFHILGPLQLDVLEKSLNEVIRRHEMLRTTLETVDGHTMQVIRPTCARILHVSDLQDFPEGERYAEAVRQATEEAGHPFDFAREPLFRTILLQLAESEFVLLLVINHLASDGWGIRVLLRELSSFYRNFIARTPLLLPEPPIQYADFGTWQREWLQGEVLTRQLTYWKKQLEGAASGMALPYDHLTPVRPSFQSETLSFRLSDPLSGGLRGLSRQEGVTLFTTLLAAWQTLLQRYSLRDDIIVGTTVSNRNRSETEEMVGNCGNNLLLRTDFSNNPTFRELLHRVRDVVIGAFEHQDLPLEKLREVSLGSENGNGVPYFQMMFVMRDSDLVQNLDLPDLTLTSIPIKIGMTALDLTLDMTDGHDGLSGSLEYKTDLFESTTIAQMLEDFEILLATMVANPERRISDLNFVARVIERVEKRRDRGRKSGPVARICHRQDIAGRNRQVPFVPPGTEVERLVAKVWQEILGLERIGLNDNFFDLGARSLHISQVRAKLLEVLHKDISLISFFEHPTVSSLTRHLDHAATEQASSEQRQRAEGRRASRVRRRERVRSPDK